ncbi:hypothetical protein RNJ44_04116 [Nakaseomyces bracarensis]|uniref:Uncharacterized protein n=1 Tax=Nakaseomyces bracarensis TaxID=273131 RepID=A0ABR4NU00_9SACH
MTEQKNITVKKIVVPEQPVNPEWLWQPKDDLETIDELDLPEKTYLCFGVFWLDIYSTPECDRIELEKVLEDLQLEFDKWNVAYPWSEYNGVTLKLEELDRNKRSPYILGYHCVEDNIEDEEGIVLSILANFSKKASQYVFIKICDTDGDFILSECNNILPREYEYPVANNRFWLHEGRFKTIPLSFYPDRGLVPSECMEFLLKGVYKCNCIQAVQDRIEDKFTSVFPEGYFHDLRSLPLKFVDGKIFNIIEQNPSIVTYLIKQLLIPGIEKDLAFSKLQRESETFSLNVIVPKKILSILIMYVKQFYKDEDENMYSFYYGEVISSLLDRASKDRDIQLVEKTNEANVIADLFSKITIKAVDSKDIQERGDPNASDTFDTLINLIHGEEDLTEDVEDLSSDSNDSITSYFRSENVDIDEDDFFEFFLTEALGIKNNEMPNYRNTSSRNK